MPRQAPASNEVLAGSGTACSAGSTIDWAAVPKARRHCPFQTHTRSPTRAGETASPTASISPAPSLCGMTRGKAILRVNPARLLTSEGLTPEVRSRTRTSPRPGCGVSTSATRNTSRADPFPS